MSALSRTEVASMIVPVMVGKCAMLADAAASTVPSEAGGAMFTLWPSPAEPENGLHG